MNDYIERILTCLVQLIIVMKIMQSLRPNNNPGNICLKFLENSEAFTYEFQQKSVCIYF